ncbi:hypothetical protein F7734_05470 [Scytonema sp. UIC 10036]|uniref:hypothetical protein n=1 Tax=Scytonema sp. UIC 10036 TaxID=2304196 RepID=UPI0012DAE498|nr:hypothetical protein [Scytonema sp. UIC 10036]MUG91939.1 hypothetical protein [Scytonema sp. UIC 10036]
MTYKVYAPNVHLFAFHLRDDSGSNEKYDNQLLWKKCGEIFQKFKIQQDLKIKDVAPGSRVDLLEEATNANIGMALEGAISLETSQKTRITGIACPLQIYDSYALALNLRVDELDEAKNKTEEVDINIFNNFNPDNCFLPTSINSSLGQTLILTAWLSKAQQQDSKLWREIADKCVQNFLGQKREHPQLYQEGQLFDSPIFEYGIPDSPNIYEHTLVWLFFAEEDGDKYSAKADENLSLFYQEFIDLFFYRNKVIKAYHFSRDAYRDTYEVYKKIKQTVHEIVNIRLIENNSLVTNTNRDLSYGLNNFKNQQKIFTQNKIVPKVSKENNLTVSNTIRRLSNIELKNYQDKLSILPLLDLQYYEYLTEFDKYRITIDTNTKNYTEKLRQIQEKASNENLQFLSNFNQIISINFSNQIQTDLGYFAHNSGLVDKAITSIRGLVEIEQAERDRSLENTIRILGIGFGGGAIISGVIVQHIDKIKIPLISPNNSPNPFYASLILSLIATLGFMGLGCLITQGNSILEKVSRKMRKTNN